MDGDENIVVNIDPDLVDLIPQFLANRRADVAELRKALTASDLAAVRRVAHNLKGIGGGYGFPMITDIGGAISVAAKQDDREAIRALSNALEDYLDRVVVR